MGQGSLSREGGEIQKFELEATARKRESKQISKQQQQQHLELRTVPNARLSTRRMPGVAQTKALRDSGGSDKRATGGCTVQALF